MSFPLSSLPPSFHVVKLVAPSSWMTPFRPLALITVGQSHRCQSALSVCRTFVDRKQIRHEKNLTYTTISHNVVHEGSSRTLLTRTSSRFCPTGRSGSRDMSTSDNVREILYESPSISTLQNLAMGSVAQAAICCVVGGLLTFHPAAASSAWLPGWTLQGRAFLSGIIIGFGGTITIGARAFVTKQIIRVSWLPLSTDEIEIDVMSFPSGVTVHRVPAKEFYAITAAYGEFDIDKEATGPAPMLPVYVGGSVKNTLMIDMRGKFLGKARMQELLVSVPELDEEELKNH